METQPSDRVHTPTLYLAIRVAQGGSAAPTVWGRLSEMAHPQLTINIAEEGATTSRTEESTKSCKSSDLGGMVEQRHRQ